MDDNDSGVTVTWIGDFNGDRLTDLAVGLPAMNGGDGQLFIAGLGANIAPTGDTNGDGFDDLLIGDPLNNRIFLVYGRSDNIGIDTLLDGDNLAKWVEITPADGEAIGTVMAIAGDVNNDTVSDFAARSTCSQAMAYGRRMA